MYATSPKLAYLSHHACRQSRARIVEQRFEGPWGTKNSDPVNVQSCLSFLFLWFFQHFTRKKMVEKPNQHRFFFVFFSVCFWSCPKESWKWCSDSEVIEVSKNVYSFTIGGGNSDVFFCIFTAEKLGEDEMNPFWRTSICLKWVGLGWNHQAVLFQNDRDSHFNGGRRSGRSEAAKKGTW